MNDTHRAQALAQASEKISNLTTRLDSVTSELQACQAADHSGQQPADAGSTASPNCE